MEEFEERGTPFTKIEEYAVDLVGSGAESVAEDDLDEDGEFDNPEHARVAADLAVKMARTIRENPVLFRNWYLMMQP